MHEEQRRAGHQAEASNRKHPWRYALLGLGTAVVTAATLTGTQTLASTASEPTAGPSVVGAPPPPAPASAPSAPPSGPTARTTVAAAPARSAALQRPTCNARTTKHQERLERHLGLFVDGRNSRTDCGAIKAFQKRHGLRSPDGRADQRTVRITRRLDKARERAHLCSARKMVVCADLTSQTVWIAEHGTITYGPFPMRSGRPKFESDTGTFPVFLKSRHHFSSQYEVPMPYAMFYNAGEALHVSRRYLYKGKGTHGCVQILPNVAPEMWRRIQIGTTVQVFGSGSGGSTGTARV